MEVVRRADRRDRVSEKPNGAKQNMRPKGKLLGLLAIFAAIGLVTATGAFTTVSAQRTVDVNVAGDASALLQLTQDNSAYTSYENGELVIDFTSPGSAQGINANATTVVVNLFTATNQGSDEIDLTWSMSGTNTGAITLLNSSESNANNHEPANQPVNLSSGESYGFGIKLDTTGSGGGGVIGNNSDIRADLTLNATSTSA